MWRNLSALAQQLVTEEDSSGSSSSVDDSSDDVDNDDEVLDSEDAGVAPDSRVARGEDPNDDDDDVSNNHNNLDGWDDEDDLLLEDLSGRPYENDVDEDHAPIATAPSATPVMVSASCRRRRCNSCGDMARPYGPPRQRRLPPFSTAHPCTESRQRDCAVSSALPPQPTAGDRKWDVSRWQWHFSL